MHKAPAATVSRPKDPAPDSLDKPRDPNTLSNYHQWRAHHVTNVLEIDFDGKRVHGTTSIVVKKQIGASDEIVLDTSYLDIRNVEASGHDVDWTLAARHEIYGSALSIKLPAHTEDTISLEISFATTAQCTALQWLSPAQNGIGKHPYMFSQCQAIHARSLFPCQDTPDVKTTYEFRVTSPLPVLASGIPVNIIDSDHDGPKTYVYKQDVPIPAYLFALASGDVTSARIGPRSTVWSSPDFVDACKWELEEDTERFIETAEKLVFPYVWGQYNVLILPNSFPYGGMENPTTTFATGTIISGDRQNVHVIAHELAHSWSGNLVTNCSWEHFWLNEGWTTYLERRIQAEGSSEAHYDFAYIIGWSSLVNAVDRMGKTSETTQLIIDHRGKDPDELFSVIPYEKGAIFLRYLESLVGREKWDAFIPHYFTKYKERSLDSFEFRATLIDHFASDEAASKQLESIDWDYRFYAPGLPPKPEYDTSLSDACVKLADRWLALADGADTKEWTPSHTNINDMVSNQLVVFLDTLDASDKKLTPALIEQMGTVYNFATSKNVEVLMRYLRVGLHAKTKSLYEPTASLLSRVGRMKFVQPLYAALKKCDEGFARHTFEHNKDFYHPICKAMVVKLLDS